MFGFKRFYDLLLKLDPKIKGRILPTDSQRAQRAYEVKLKTKKSLFDWFVNTKSDFLDFEIKKIFIDIPRNELLKKISQRTELMIKKNCINKVRKFNSFNAWLLEKPCCKFSLRTHSQSSMPRLTSAIIISMRFITNCPRFPL